MQQMPIRLSAYRRVLAKKRLLSDWAAKYLSYLPQFCTACFLHSWRTQGLQANQSKTRQCRSARTLRQESGPAANTRAQILPRMARRSTERQARANQSNSPGMVDEKPRA